MAQLSDDCFAFGGRLIPLHEAEQRLGDQFGPVVPAEQVSLAQADGRVLASDLVAAMNLPRESNSAVDGYAVHFDDLSATGDTRLALAGRAAAGHPIATPLPRGHAARIFTGALMPEGPDTVLMQEDCILQDGAVLVRPGIRRGANRRLAGEDVAAGDTVLRAGRRLGPPEVGLAAALGATRLQVRARLRVALFSTGDELADPGALLARGRIYDSNRPMIACLLQRAGAEVADGGILPDRVELIEAALRDAATANDLIVTTGGVSTGEEDHVREAIQRLGTLSFWRLGIKPGRPVAVGMAGGVPMVGLPGNPVAAMVTYMAVARPLIALLGGEAYRPPLRTPAVSGFAYRKKRDRREYVRVRLHEQDGALVAQRFAKEGAGILTSLTESDALAELPEAMTELAVGEPVPCIPLGLIYG